jgi:hypothetical protein
MRITNVNEYWRRYTRHFLRTVNGKEPKDKKNHIVKKENKREPAQLNPSFFFSFSVKNNE